MKGIVFTEFVEMVEEKFGYEVMDSIFESLNLPSGGVYTSVGTYAHSEMVQLVTSLSQHTQIPISELLKAYGKHLLLVFTNSYPHFFVQSPNAFSLFEQIDKYIHVEVRKLYPDAELPKFEVNYISDNSLEMIYESDRKMADLAEGLIEATIEYYQETSTTKKIILNEDGSKVKFIITKHE
jgi:hypothetical protein